MRFPRSSGILLHPTSLPGPYGVGDLGPAAYRFADFLAAAGQSLWQVLPLGPTGYGDSPYQCFSALAGNPVLISPELLVQQGWLDACHPPEFPQDEVDYARVIPWKMALLESAMNAILNPLIAKLHLNFTLPAIPGLSDLENEVNAIQSAYKDLWKVIDGYAFANSMAAFTDAFNEVKSEAVYVQYLYNNCKGQP